MNQSSLWLLDHNIPKTFKRFLSSQDVGSIRAIERGWEQLSNGKLVAAASDVGIHVILTLDRQFNAAAAKTLEVHPKTAIVLISLPQQLSRIELMVFLQSQWSLAQIRPIHGHLVRWPPSVGIEGPPRKPF